MYNYQGGTVGNTALFPSLVAFGLASFGYIAEIEAWEGLMRAAVKYICLLISRFLDFSPSSHRL